MQLHWDARTEKAAVTMSPLVRASDVHDPADKNRIPSLVRPSSHPLTFNFLQHSFLKWLQVIRWEAESSMLVCCCIQYGSHANIVLLCQFSRASGNTGGKK